MLTSSIPHPARPSFPRWIQALRLIRRDSCQASIRRNHFFAKTSFWVNIISLYWYFVSFGSSTLVFAVLNAVFKLFRRAVICVNGMLTSQRHSSMRTSPRASLSSHVNVQIPPPLNCIRLNYIVFGIGHLFHNFLLFSSVTIRKVLSDKRCRILALDMALVSPPDVFISPGI